MQRAKIGSKMHILHALPSLDLDSGGPPQSVSALASRLCDEDLEISVIAAGGSTVPEVALDPRIRRIRVFGGGMSTGRRLSVSSYSVPMQDLHRKRAVDCVVQNGLWLKSAHQVCFHARKLSLPLIVAPRGMLESWAMNFHGSKKRVAWMLYQRADLCRATAFHATSKQEVESIRKAGLTQPIITLPNGVVPPERCASGGCETLFPEDGRVALFLSRIHPKKGLPILIEAWGRLKPAGWTLWIAGNDCDGHTARLRELVALRSLKEKVRFTGPLFGDDKAAALRRADLFVLPSYSENFGIVVAEALSYGVPVIATTGTPWEELNTKGCGWWVRPEADALVEAIKSAISSDPYTLRDMGLNGKKLVAARYLWASIAKEMADSYRWLCGRGEKPDCVVEY